MWSNPVLEQRERVTKGIEQGLWADKKDFYQFQQALYLYANNPINGIKHPRGFVNNLTEGLLGEYPDLSSLAAYHQWRSTGEYVGDVYKPWLVKGELLPEFKSYLVQGLRKPGDTDSSIATEIGWLLSQPQKMWAQWDSFKRLCERETHIRATAELQGANYFPPPNLMPLPQVPDTLALPATLEEKALPPVDPNFQAKLALAFENAGIGKTKKEKARELAQKKILLRGRAMTGAKAFLVKAPAIPNRKVLEEAIYAFLMYETEPELYTAWLESGGISAVNHVFANDETREQFWDNYSLLGF